MNTIVGNQLNTKLCDNCRKYQSGLFINDEDNNNNNNNDDDDDASCNCSEVESGVDEANETQVKKEGERGIEKDVDSGAEIENGVEGNIEISKNFETDETEEKVLAYAEKQCFDECINVQLIKGMKEIMRQGINGENNEKDKSINNGEYGKRLNDVNYENEIKVIRGEIKSEEEEGKDEKEEKEEEEEIINGKNNLTRFFKNVDQYINNDDILNDTNDEKEYAKETFDINCPHCKKELPYHGEGVTICLETCRHILCRYCISNLLNKFINNEIVELRCPYVDAMKCDVLIDEAKHDIEMLVQPDLYNKYLMSLSKKLEGDIETTVFCCKTFKCEGWCVIEGNSVDNFLCPVCKRNNHVNLNTNKNEISEDAHELTYMQNERYNELMLLMENDIVPNFEPFECPICLVPYKPHEGPCIANTVLFSDVVDVKCPYKDDNYSCDSTIQQCEIKAVLKSDDFKKYLQRSIELAESKAGSTAYHCKTPDCPGWCIYEQNVETFLCPVCEQNNCLLCKKIHKKSCTEDMINVEPDSQSDHLIQQMLQNQKALSCPTCKAVIMKVDGCDAVICTVCKTEICWLTRGPRWGPKGRGDTSGGCKCSAMLKCHPLCRNCH